MQALVRQYSFSQFGASRQDYKPTVPITLSTLMCKAKESTIPIGQEIKKLFPVLTASPMPLIQFLLSDNQVVQFPTNPIKIGVILSGGQAPGGHNVIAGIFDFAKRLNSNSTIYGFKMGPHGLMNNNYIEIMPEYMDLFRNQGGFDMICSGRDKIKTPDQFASSLQNATSLDLDGLVVIGGDDSNTNACLLAQYFKEHSSKCRVVGAPKTIDGDLMNQYIPVSFGFHTATRIYSQFIGNLCLDALSSKKYYHFIRLMGRSASHIALECALLTRPNHVIIGQEVAQKKLTLKQITDNIADIVCLRATHGKEYGVILVPEGLIQFIPEINPLIQKIGQLFKTNPQFADSVVAKITTSQLRSKVSEALPQELAKIFVSLPISIADQLLLGRDSHGNLPVSKIDTQKLLILMVETELAHRKSKGSFGSQFTAQAHFFGYQGRCGHPSPFDSDYCYSIGETATALISLGYTGYMATIRNIQKSNNPSEWIASGSPLPIMIHMETREGKSIPVIKKALVELDNAPFRALQEIREIWAEFDCYQPPGPIQFQGVPLDIPFVIRPLPIDKLKAEAKDIVTAQNEFQEMQGHVRKGGKKEAFYSIKHIHHLGVVGKIRMNQVTPIPRYLEEDQFCLHPVKQQKICKDQNQFGELAQQDLKEITRNPFSNTYVSISTKAQAKHLRRPTDGKCYNQELQKLIESFTEMDKCRAQNKFKIGVLFNGRQSPGGNNIIQGLLRFASCGMRCKGAVQILGFLNGTKGFFNGEYRLVTQENFRFYRNQGGYDSLGRSADQIHTTEQLIKAAQVCHSLQLDGLVLIGATHTMSDGLYLSNYFLQQNIKTSVAVIPCSIDGNVNHKQIQSSIGFDTASKGCSQLIGNIMTDAASAIKYWYFIRLMGRDPSHLVLQSALKTHPNCVLISQAAAARGQTIQNIVNEIADLICQRAAQNKNFGTVIIPQGLLFHLPHFRHLIKEVDRIFNLHSQNDSFTDNIKFKQSLYEDPRKLDEMLSPWSAMVFKMLPEFIQKQLLLEREVNGGVQLSQIETQRLLAYLVEQELKKRKYKQKYGFSFSTVTHFFGYQSRCSLPSRFDCSLASTSGFGAGVLVTNGMTGMTVVVKNTIKTDVNEWQVGGAPLIGLAKTKIDEGGKKKLAIKSWEVDLGSKAYKKLILQMKKWQFIDHYSNPGPIQYFYPKIKDALTQTLFVNETRKVKKVDKIKNFLASLDAHTLFNSDEKDLNNTMNILEALEHDLAQ